MLIFDQDLTLELIQIDLVGDGLLSQSPYHNWETLMVNVFSS